MHNPNDRLDDLLARLVEESLLPEEQVELETRLEFYLFLGKERLLHQTGEEIIESIVGVMHPASPPVSGFPPHSAAVPPAVSPARSTPCADLGPTPSPQI